MNVAKICDGYRAMLDRFGFSAETVYYYPIELQKFLEFVKSRGKNKIEDIDEVDYILYRNKLEDANYSKKMVIKKMSAVKTWIRLNYERNPTDTHFANLHEKVNSVRMSLSKKGYNGGYKPIPLEHFLQILKTASTMETETRLFIYILATTGGRSQFYGLTLGNIDLDNRLIKVFVKGEKYIEVPIIELVAHLIIEHLKMKYLSEFKEIKEMLIKKGEDADDERIIKEYIINRHSNEFLFSHGKDVYSEKLSWERIKKNRRANTRNAERILKRVCEHAGLWICKNCGKVGVGKSEDNKTRCDVCNKKVEFVHYTPHQIRKAIATHGYELGLSLEGTSDLLGHSNIGITKRFYRGKQTQKVREELRGIGDLLDKIEGEKFNTN